MAPPSSRKPRALPVPPEVWAPIVARLLGDGLAVEVMTQLQHGALREEILASLELTEEDYQELLRIIHDTAVPVVKACRAYALLREGRQVSQALEEEERVDLEVIRLFAIVPTLIDLFDVVPLPPQRVVDVLSNVALRASR